MSYEDDNLDADTIKMAALDLDDDARNSTLELDTRRLSELVRADAGKRTDPREVHPDGADLDTTGIDTTGNLDSRELTRLVEESTAESDASTIELDTTELARLEVDHTGRLDPGALAGLLGDETTRITAEVLPGLLGDETTRITAEVLRGEANTAVMNPDDVRHTVRMDEGSRKALTDMQAAVHQASVNTTPVRYLDPMAPRPRIIALPPGWSPERMERWLNALHGALVQFGGHGYERLEPHELDAIRQRFGATEDDLKGEGPRAKFLREYLGIHSRSDDDTTVAEIAAANASMLGSYILGFAGSMARSVWDILEVVEVGAAENVLLRLHDGGRVVVNASLDNHAYEPGQCVVTRLVEFRDIVVATSNLTVTGPEAGDVLRVLNRNFVGGDWRAFMRREGANCLLRFLFERLPVRRVTRLGDRFQGCDRLEVVELHRLFTELEVGLQEEVDLAREVEFRDATGYAEVFDDALRFILYDGLETWVLRRLSAHDLHVDDIRLMESFGLRPRLHGMVAPNRRIEPRTIVAAAGVVRQLLA